MNEQKEKGVDLDKLSDPAFVFQQVNEVWERLSWEEKKAGFLVLLDERAVKGMRSVLNSLDENKQGILIEEAGRLIKRFREEMPEGKRGELKEILSSEEKRNVIKNIERYYLTELTPEEQEKLHPIVEEIVNTLEEVEK